VTRGTATGNLVAGHRVDAVLTGHIGRKAMKALQTAGVKIYVGASGRLQDAIASFKTVKYEEKT